MRYAKQFKESVVNSFFISGMGQREYAHRVGVDRGTLIKWLEEISPKPEVKRSDLFLDINIHDKDKNWPPEDKIWAVMTYEGLGKNSKGAFLRKNGLYSSQIFKWKKEMIEGLSLGNKKLSKIVKYEKELRAKRAVIELQKKTQKILVEKESN